MSHRKLFTIQPTPLRLTGIALIVLGIIIQTAADTYKAVGKGDALIIALVHAFGNMVIFVAGGCYAMGALGAGIRKRLKK